MIVELGRQFAKENPTSRRDRNDEALSRRSLPSVTHIAISNRDGLHCSHLTARQFALFVDGLKTQIQA